MEKQHLIKEKWFHCPICVETPVAEVYQCVKGHILCDGCILKVKTCPQCRVPFGPTKTRNLAFEAVLDQMIFNCPFEEYGCTLKLKRPKLKAHNKICPLRTVNICRTLGYTNCERKVQSGVDLIYHLHGAHGMEMDDSKIKNKTTLSFDYENGSFDSDMEYEYMPAKINGNLEPFLFLLKICPGINGLTINGAVIYVGKGLPKITEEISVQIYLGVDFKNELTGTIGPKRICAWTGFPVHFKNAEDVTLIPYFSTPMNYVKSRFNLKDDTDFLLFGKAKITEARSLSEDESSDDSGDENSSDDSDTAINGLINSGSSPKRDLVAEAGSGGNSKKMKLN